MLYVLKSTVNIRIVIKLFLRTEFESIFFYQMWRFSISTCFLLRISFFIKKNSIDSRWIIWKCLNQRVLKAPKFLLNIFEEENAWNGSSFCTYVIQWNFTAHNSLLSIDLQVHFFIQYILWIWNININECKIIREIINE